MHDLCLLNVIVPREDDERLLSFFEANRIHSVACIPCHGTARKSILSLLGLEETEKSFLYIMTTRSNAKKLIRGMVRDLGLDMPGSGVAFTVPAGSIAGASSLRQLTAGQDIILEEVNDMPQTFLYELIIAIADRGHAETVMEAARSAGAMGGTVIHARSAGQHAGNVFFGLSLAEEKDMLTILCAAHQKTALMRAIMEKAGVDSPARTVMFTLPVESVAGLRSVMEAAGETEP